MKTILLFLASVLFVLPQSSWAQPPEDAMLYISRTMGFRPPGFMTPQSDYGFEIKKNGEWKYNSFAPQKDRKGPKTGELMMPMESFIEQLQILGLDDLPEPDPNAPKIADLPKMTIRRKVDGKAWVREIPPRSDIAMELHYLIQQIVLGVKEIPTKDFPLVEDKPVGIDKPRTLKTSDELEEAFGKEKAGELLNRIDLEKKQLVIFRWAGSGQDELFANLEGEDDAEQLVFGYRRGMTRDLRQHARYYVVERGQEWKIEKMPPARFNR